MPDLVANGSGLGLEEQPASVAEMSVHKMTEQCLSICANEYTLRPNHQTTFQLGTGKNNGTGLWKQSREPCVRK